MRRSGVRFLFPAPVDSRTYTNSELVYLYRASSGLAPDNGSPPEHDNLAFRSTAFGQCDFCNLCFFGNSELKSIYSLKAKVRSAPKPAVDAHRTPTPTFSNGSPLDHLYCVSLKRFQNSGNLCLKLDVWLVCAWCAWCAASSVAVGQVGQGGLGY